MSMSSTQKPQHVYQVRQSSAQPLNKNQSQPQFMSCQKQLRMSIIDQLSPIKDLQVSQRNSFYQVKGKCNVNPLLVTTKTQPSRLSESSTLNYTQESNQKTKKLSNSEILKDQLRFSISQLMDIKTQCHASLSMQIDQVIQVIRSAQNYSNSLADNSQQQDYQKLKGIMEQMQNKITLLVQDNTTINRQFNECQQYNNQLMNQIQQLKMQSNKENYSPNLQPKFSYSQRELAYKLEQAEVRLLTLQISNDNLKQQLQHNALDYQQVENLKTTCDLLEQKSQELINQKDSLSQENELLHRKVHNQESALNETRQQLNQTLTEREQTSNLEIQIKRYQLENQQLLTTNAALNNTLAQMREQTNILSQQLRETSDQSEQYKQEVYQHQSKSQAIWNDLCEMRSKLEQRAQSENNALMRVKEYEQRLENESRTICILQNNLEQQIQRKDRELSQRAEEILHYKQLYDQQVNKNQQLETRILYFMEQEVNVYK